MSKVERYWPVALSSVPLALGAFFLLTDTAWRLMGCPAEVYPEAAFLLIVGPAAFVSFLLAIKAATNNSPSLARRALIVGSVVLSAICVGLTLLFIWPTGGKCL